MRNKIRSTPHLIAKARLVFALLGMLSVSAFSLQSSVFSQSSILTKTPVKNVRTPIFNDQGNRTALIHAEQATAINSTQVDIRGLDFTQYYGDGSTRQRARITAPTASVFSENKQSPRIAGKESVHMIYESDLDVTGEDWTYDHGAKKLNINRNSHVVLKTPLKSTASTASASTTSGPTNITSDSLELAEQVSPATTRAILTGNVHVTSDDIVLVCDHLEIVTVDLLQKNAPEANGESTEYPAIDKLITLVATGNVKVTQDARSVTCGRAEVFPRDDKIVLTQSPVVSDSEAGIVAAGETLTFLQKDRRVEGTKIRATLPPLQAKPGTTPAIGKSAGADTIVTSDHYAMWDTEEGASQADFQGNVRVTTTDYKLDCDHLELFADEAAAKSSKSKTTKQNDDPSLADVRLLLATGNVRMVDQYREVICGRAEVLPREDKIILTEMPVLTDFATASIAMAHTFTILKSEKRLLGEVICITLPPLDDLSRSNPKGTAPQKSQAATPTIITSRNLVMWSADDNPREPLTYATFDQDVLITATNLRLTCDKLELVADDISKKGKEQPHTTALSQVPSIELIPSAMDTAARSEAKPKTPDGHDAAYAALRWLLATGNVHLIQPELEATCGRAEVLPRQDKITLTEKPVVIDHLNQVVVSGSKLSTIRGQKDIQGEDIRITAAGMKIPGLDKATPPATVPQQSK